MSQTAEFDAGSLIVRQYVARLLGVNLIMPAAKTITSSTVNAFDQVNNAGLPVPDAAPTIAFQGTGITGGPLAYYIVFYCEDTDTESNPSAQSSSLSPSNQGIRITNAATNNAANSRVTHWRIYRNTTGSSIYRRVATVAIATTTYDDTATDASISANDPLELDNDAPVANSYSLPIVAKNVMFLTVPYNQRGGTAFDDLILFSKTGNPDSYRSINLTSYMKGTQGAIRAAGWTNESLIIFKDWGIVEWVWDLNPHLIYGDGTAKVMSHSRGALNPDTVISIDGLLFVMDWTGIYSYAGGTRILELGRKLRGLWNRINWAVKDQFCATYDNDRAYFFVALDNETECRYAFVLDLAAWRAQQGPVWVLRRYDFGVRHAARWCTYGDNDAHAYGRRYDTVPVVMTDSGHVFELESGYREGVHYLLDAEATLTGTPTATVLPASAANFADTDTNGNAINVAGCYVRFPNKPSLPGAYRIKSATATQLTLAAALPVAPVSGDKILIGAIDYQLETPKASFGSPYERKSGALARMEFRPLAINRQIRVEFEPDGYAPRNNAAVADETGYGAEDGKEYLGVDMGGNRDEGRMGAVVVPVATEGFQYLKARLRALDVDIPAVIDSFDIQPIN